MYGNDCHDKNCLFNGEECTRLTKKMFMLCEKPSRRQIDDILKSINSQPVITIKKEG